MLASWPAGGPPRVWTSSEIGRGYSSIAVARGRVYTTGSIGADEFLFALDASDGGEVWRFRTGDTYENERGGGPRSTPTVDGDRVFVLGASGELWAVSVEGRALWHLPILETFQVSNLAWGLSESPIVEGGKVIIATGSAGGSVVAFDRDSGAIVWQSKGLVEAPGYASAIAVTVGGVRQIVHSLAEHVVGIRARDGELLWSYAGASNPWSNCTTPIFRDDRVFVTSAYDTGGALLKLTSTRDQTDAAEVWFTRDLMNHHGGVVLVDRFLYGFSKSVLTCLDFATGELQWKDRSVGNGSVIAADGMLYVLSQRGRVALVRTTPESYQEVSRFELEPDENPRWAHPAIADGRLYIRDGDRIHCYGVKGP